MAEEQNISENDDTPGAGETVQTDLSFIPEAFKGEDGGYKVDDFKAHYDELATFKSQADEAKAALPESPDGYAWAIPEDFAFAEGFNPEVHPVPVLDDDGNPVMENGKPKTRPMEATDLLDANDPDLKLLQSSLHEAGANPSLAGKLAGIMVNREIRSLMEAGQKATEEKKALGPDAQSRIDVVERSLASRLPQAQVKAVLQDITSADALRGVEALLKASKTPPSGVPGNKIDNATASIDDRIMAGLRGR